MAERRNPIQLQELERSWDPWRQLDMLQDAMTRVLWGQRSGESTQYPALNAWTNQNQAIITAEIPGIDADTLDINVIGDTLTLRGTREPEPIKEGETLLRGERNLGSFSRSLQLPFQVDAPKVTARAKNGVLIITLPRAEAEKPRKVAVKPA
jgi:HSP20 family protein